MTDPRRSLPGRRDAERLLDARGRHGQRPDAGDTRLDDEIGRLLADAATPPLVHDPVREHEALRHFRAAVRRPAPAPRTVRQRVAALSATAKVVGLAVGATATGGVAIASTSMPLPLTHGLRPGTSESADYPSRPASHGPDATTSAGPTTIPATTPALPAATRTTADGSPRARNDRRHGRGVVPGLPFPIGTMPVDEGGDYGGGSGGGGGGGVTTPPVLPTTPIDLPTTEPTAPQEPPPTTAPTTPPPISRGPGWEEPPGEEAPTDEVTTPPAEETTTDEPTPGAG